MDFFIKLVDGQPVGHPISKTNFERNLKTLSPEDFASFERVPVPVIGYYEIYIGCTYEWVGDIVKDVHAIRPMTANEKQAKIDRVLQNNPYPSWVFDETLCAAVPPIAMPDDGNSYVWDETTISWVATSSE